MEENLPVQIDRTSQPLAENPNNPGQAKLTVQQRAAMAKAERQADIIQDAAFPASMAAAIPLGSQVGASGFKIYLDRLLEDAGSPTDPIEKMMIEQLALAHHRIAQLHVQADSAETVDAKKVYAAAAVRLTGEFRRLGLAIRVYRQPISTKHFTVVKQQNIAKGDQQVAYLDHSDAESSQNKVPSLPDDRKQESNRLTDDRTPALSTQSQTGGCWSKEPAEARPTDAQRTREAAASSLEEPSLGEVDWTKDR